ncbi:MAG TPA: DUF222 domain-containing protein [Actinomycetales bacterium]|nr:DUF222 domain-containing protein [Actinomycetales bacterium]
MASTTHSDSPGGDPIDDVSVPCVEDPTAAAVVARLNTSVEALARCEPWRLTDGDLAALVQVSEVAHRRLLMIQVAAAVEAGKRGLPCQAGFGPGRGTHGGDTAALGAWLRSLVNVSRGEARHRAEVGAVLFIDPVAVDLAETRAAALAGQVSTRHVSAIAAAVGQLSPPMTPVDVVDEDTRRDAQRVLAESAAVLDPSQTKVLAKRTLAVLDPTAGDRLAKDEDLRDIQRGLSFTPDGTGLVHVRGVLTPVCAGLLATAIDADSAPRPAADGSPDQRSPAQRRHDGLQHVLEQVVAADGLLPSTHGSPYRLVVTVPHSTLSAELQRTSARGGAPVDPGLLPDGWPISPLAVQTMACSADVVPVLVDEDNQPLDVGDTQYAFPPKIRTAIIARDKGCTYPGCGAPAPWCDVHHLIKFRSGGSTSVENGALLCGRHHRYVHALGLEGQVASRDGTSRVLWDHRPTSWTATTATTVTTGSSNPAASTWAARRAHPASSDAATAPALTDRCLDELVRRWRRRMRDLADRAA